MINKNEYYQLECIDLTHEGLGVCKLEDYTLFVSNMMPGEIGKIKVVQTKKNYGFGRMIELIKTSPNRQTPPCEIYKECGGCQIQHMDSIAQKEMKTNRVRQAFKRIANLELEVHETNTMEDPWHYRNKVALPIQKTKENEYIYGFYRSRSHDIIPMDHCLIQNDLSNEIVKEVVQLLKENKVEPYNEVTLKGTIRHIVTRYGLKTKEVMLILVTNEPTIKNIETIIQSITNKYPQIKTIVQNINDQNTNVILGNKDKVLYGDGYIYDYIDDIQFKISSKSFYQVNPIQTEVLYKKALELAELTGNEIVIDAYCGIGTISLFMAKNAKHVYGVEIVEDAIKDAKENAKINNINNVTFVVNDAEEQLIQWKNENIQADVVMIDPPRKGCSENFLKTLVEINPKKIVYVSCDVSTQARDVKYLMEQGYTTNEVFPVDMFPQTYHVETVVMLTKINKL